MVVTTAREVLLAPSGYRLVVAKHPTKHKTGPTTKNYTTQNIKSTKTETPWYKGVDLNLGKGSCSSF